MEVKALSDIAATTLPLHSATQEIDRPESSAESVSFFLTVLFLLCLIVVPFLAACFDGEVRLRNNTYNNFNGLNSEFGVVLVCVNQQFVYVCSNGWDDREAEVACRTYRSDYRSPFYGMSHTRID